MSKKIIIAAGGTGGHLYPAQAVARKLQKRGVEILFLAKGLSSNPYFNGGEFQFKDVSSATFSKNVLRNLQEAFLISKGVAASYLHLSRFRPDLVIGFGSYHSFPVLAASILKRIPFITHESNAYPGKVNRLLSKRALWTGVFFDEAREHLRGITKRVNVPLRDEFNTAYSLSKEAARSDYGLHPNKTTLLVFGGSQGAKRLNEIMIDAACYLPRDELQILHITGSDTASDSVRQAYIAAGVDCFVAGFEHNMLRAYRAADAAFCRSGAMTVAELICVALPAIMVPFPFAVDNHQLRNAEAVVKKGCGIILEETHLTRDCLIKAIMSLFRDTTLKKMKDNLRYGFEENNTYDFFEKIYQHLE